MTYSQGIYTLANDNLYDQVIALIQSIRRNDRAEIPICIIPYDQKIDRLRSLNYPHVFLFDDARSWERWFGFATDIWTHPRFADKVQQNWYHGSNTIRKLCSFDGPFERFIYVDSDALVMSSLDRCFELLNEYDFVFDDWEHGKQKPFLNLALVQERYGLADADARQYLHCSDFFAAKANVITPEVLAQAKQQLLDQDDVQLLETQGWWDEVYLFSYLTLWLRAKVFNYTRSDDPRDRTGNIAGVDPFVEQDQRLVNAQGLKPIRRIHYMGYASELFRRLCAGEAVDIPHRELFLDYRFMDHPEARPQVLKPPGVKVRSQRAWQKLTRKMSKFVGQ